ncbi:hypothetical protein L7F22_005277 [Adiantum nelumboides]|nr:hypothetical protein [Adiantum nelumboides]
MVGSSLVALRVCTASFPDSNHDQLQLLSPPEATAACLSPPSNSRRQSRPRPCFVRATAKPLSGSCFSKEESFYCRCKPCACVHGGHTAAPLLEPCESVLAMQNSQSFEKRKNRKRIFVVCTSTNTMLDRCNDTDDVVSSAESHWTEEALSSLQRSLLESQWALQSAENPSCKNEVSLLENFTARSSEESVNLCTHPQQLGDSVVRSGQASARCRRLAGRSKGDALGRCGESDSLKASIVALPVALPVTSAVKNLKAKVKPDRVQSFVYTYLKASNGCGMLTKDEEKGFTKQMRVCQNLEKVKRELKRNLGYDPSYELWAQSVKLSTEEIIQMVREGELARDKMVHSHLRLVVSVARSYENLGVDLSDLVLEGSKGLLRGLEKFDYRKGHKLCTYVHWWIRQGVSRAVAEHSRVVRVPVYMHDVIFAIRKAKNSLSLEGRPLTVKNISSMLNIPSDKITRALRVKSKLFSLDKGDCSYGLKNESHNFHELVADPAEKNDPWRLCIEENRLGKVRECLSRLSPREQKVIKWYFGIDTEAGTRATMSSIAVKLGLSKVRVRQIKDRALVKMRRSKESDGRTGLLIDLED